MQEAFMAVNILQDDPDYLINNLLLPAKERFIQDDKRFRFNSYSFGTIYTKTGPSIIDEAIDYIQMMNAKYQR